MKNAPKAHPCRNVAYPNWKRGASLRKLGGLGVPLCKRGTPLRKLVAPLYKRRASLHKLLHLCIHVVHLRTKSGAPQRKRGASLRKLETPPYKCGASRRKLALSTSGGKISFRNKISWISWQSFTLWLASAISVCCTDERVSSGCR